MCRRSRHYLLKRPDCLTKVRSARPASRLVAEYLQIGVTRREQSSTRPTDRAIARHDRRHRLRLVRLPATQRARGGELLDAFESAPAAGAGVLAVLLQTQGAAQRDLRIRLLRPLDEPSAVAGLGVLWRRKRLRDAGRDVGTYRGDPTANRLRA